MAATKNNTKHNKKTLTPKQERFCREYLIDLNASQAAIRAGYSTKGAVSFGSQLLGNINIQKRINELKTQRAERCDISADSVLRELVKTAFMDIDSRTARQQKKNRVKQSDKIKALELLARHLGLLKDKLEISAEDVTLREILRGVRAPAASEGGEA